MNRNYLLLLTKRLNTPNHAHAVNHIRRSLVLTQPTISTMARRFAPLNKSLTTETDPDVRKLEGIVFDVDGTLW